jgi:hypothetical protein
LFLEEGRVLFDPLGNPGKKVTYHSFGYDYFTHNYKTVSIYIFNNKSRGYAMSLEHEIATYRLLSIYVIYFMLVLITDDFMDHC